MTMIVTAHLAVAAVVTLVVWRATSQTWVAEIVSDDAVVATLRAVLPLASASASALLLLLDRDRPVRATAADAASYAVLLVVVFALSLGPLSRDAVGLLLVFSIAARVSPTALEVATGRRGTLAAFAVALAIRARRRARPRPGRGYVLSAAARRAVDPRHFGRPARYGHRAPVIGLVPSSGRWLGR